MLKIGVSACFMYPDVNRQVFGHKSLSYLENDMARYLSRPGVMPVLLPDLAENRLMDYLQLVDGFVFQGGADICPKSYGEPYLDQQQWPGDHYRDLYELNIMAYAVKYQKPVYGICRGLQLINTYFGGKLYQDISTELSTDTEHRNAQTYDAIHHQVKYPEQGLLMSLYGKKPSITVNTVHHQAIKTLGKGLVAEAFSVDDGLIEALTYHNMQQQFILAVQWHPEFSHRLAEQVIDPEPLYDIFLQACFNKKTKKE